MYKAVWNGAVLAQSDKTIEVEGNQYFPPEDVDKSHFTVSNYHTKCPWKGLADYYNIEVDGKENRNGAWTYPEPFEKAAHIKDYVAFWNGVDVIEE